MKSNKEGGLSNDEYNIKEILEESQIMLNWVFSVMGVNIVLIKVLLKC